MFQFPLFRKKRLSQTFENKKIVIQLKSRTFSILGLISEPGKKFICLDLHLIAQRRLVNTFGHLGLQYFGIMHQWSTKMCKYILAELGTM